MDFSRQALTRYSSSPEPVNHSLNHQSGSASDPLERFFDAEGTPMQIESSSSEQRVPQQSVLQTALLAQMPSRSKSKEEYFAAWEAWVQQPNCPRDENRKEAVMRMKTWLKTDIPTRILVLSGLGLRSLPPLPPDSVHKIDLSHNQLSSWPKLPSSLWYLDVSHNQLTTVPEHIITTLENASINLENNPLYEEVIRNLHTIISATNYQGPHFILRALTELENKEVYWKEYLAAWEAWVQQPNCPRDENRKEALMRMKVWLKTDKPTRTLVLSGLGLRSLPPLPPDSVHKIDLSHNQLSNWPEDLPSSLKYLNLCHNQLASVPDRIVRTIKKDASVYLENNPFPNEVILKLSDMVHPTYYEGPHFILRQTLTWKEERHLIDMQYHLLPEHIDGLKRYMQARPWPML